MRQYRSFLGCTLLSCFLAILAGCAYEDDKIALHYEPMHYAAPILNGKNSNIEIAVRDARRIKTHVGRKIGSHGEEASKIKLEKNLKEEISEAVSMELKTRGFPLVTEETLDQKDKIIKIEIEKFFNDFKPGNVFAKASAECILHISVITKEDKLLYDNKIQGEGNHEKIWAFSGKNAKIPLDAALQDTIYKLFSDEMFLNALR